jgi:hypothetical protein
MTAADAGPSWSAWTTVTPVIAVAAKRQTYERARLPFTISDGSGAYPDVRVIDDRDAEVPFAIDPEQAQGATRTIPLIDSGFVEHQGSQAVLDLGGDGELVDTVRLVVNDAARPTYFEYVTVDASDDRRRWRRSDSTSVIYRVARDGASDRTIPIAPTRSRWLRVRVLDPHAPFPMLGAEVSRTANPGPHLLALPDTAPPAQHTSHEQVWTFAFPAPRRPVVVTFSVPHGPTFARDATADWSDDGRVWTRAGDGTIARFADGGSTLSIGLAPQTARYWRVTVRNENDAPVAGLHPVLLAAAHDIVFAAMPRRAYRVLSGEAAPVAPTYDLAARLTHSRWTAERVALGTSIPNASYRDPRPFGERYPWLLTAGLVALALILAGVAIRTIRQTSAA